MWHYVFSGIWINLHRDIEIERNRTSEELLKLGGSQQVFVFRGGVRKFSFSRGACPMRKGGLIVKGEVHT